MPCYMHFIILFPYLKIIYFVILLNIILIHQLFLLIILTHIHKCIFRLLGDDLLKLNILYNLHHVVSFAFFFLNSPTITFASSPFLIGTFLFPCSFLKLLLKLALINFLTLIGAFTRYFLCFLNCLLPFHEAENFCFIF